MLGRFGSFLAHFASFWTVLDEFSSTFWLFLLVSDLFGVFKVILGCFESV